MKVWGIFFIAGLVLIIGKGMSLITCTWYFAASPWIFISIPLFVAFIIFCVYCLAVITVIIGGISLKISTKFLNYKLI